MTRRQILDFVDETAVPYGDDYEYAVEVMTGYTEMMYLGAKRKTWETWAELPDGATYCKTYVSRDAASRGHKKAVEEVIVRMDQMALPEAEQKLRMSGLQNIDGIGGFIAEKDGVTYIRKSGKWTPMEHAVQGDPSPDCPQCSGKGLHINEFGFEVECDCRMGAEIEVRDCPECSAWLSPHCHKCGGTGAISRRKRKLF